MSEVREFAPPEALAGRLFQSLLGGVELLSVYLGERLGFYTALASRGALSPDELAATTAVNVRYVQEWLEQQATAEILAVDDPLAAPQARRYSLPPGYDQVLVDELSHAFVAPAGRFLKVMGQSSERLLEAYRTGGGVAWDELGADAREAQAAFNRPFYEHDLAGVLCQVPGLENVLGAPGARVAEIGCGAGYAAIAIANSYPQVRVDGFDLDAETVAMARANVAGSGLSQRVAIHLRDAGDGDIQGEYDLVVAFESIHDLSDPVSVLATMRRLARPGGIVLVMDERVAEQFGAFGNPIERLYYGASLFVCLPDGMSRQPSAGTGAVMRPDTLRAYAKQAGFLGLEVLPIEHTMFRFYLLES